MNNATKIARAIPQEDRPIANSQLSGISNFFGLYGGEHIAATEFVIGATLVTWGCKASDIFIGLIIGNILATLTYALICAPIAVDTHLTLYSYLKKIAGPYMQKLYNFVWGLASIAMAASMLTVSASALREIFNVESQTKWYPTSIKFVLIVIVLGAIVTIVAANGFEAVAKFSTICAPWMIVVFLSGALVALPQLINVTSFGEINSFRDFIALVNTSVWNGSPVQGGQQLGILHVIGFAWMCNLAYHGGLNDMALFRYAKSYKYGFVSGIGMFIGHFFAWGSAGIMGATASIILGQSLAVLDSGAITNVVLGGMGLLAVIVAGWTTANPSIYRASLAFQTIFDKIEIKKLTYLVGIVMTILGCLPITSNIMVIVNIIVLVVPSVGAIVLTEHWIFPKIGYTRYWSTYRKDKINKAAALAWGITILFVIIMTRLNLIHSYFLFLPTYLLASISYVVLAGIFGAKDNYLEEEKLENEVQKELLKIVEQDALKEKVAINNNSSNIRLIKYFSYAVLIVIAVLSVMVFKNIIEVNTFKIYGLVLTMVYFVSGGISVYLKSYAKGSVDNKVVDNL